ncbi:MAG TPA: B12-binding domain-containing radical SAM protein [Acetomicrobium sp.]|nr:B12-binding domain-containing radical SAM protein [Acetomicrobium sp.]
MGDFTAYLNDLRYKKILGINPPVFDFAFFDFWAKPLGLLYILEYLRHRGNSVDLIDCIYEGRDKPKTYGRYKTKRIEIEKPLPYKHIPRKFYHYGMTKESFEEKLSKTKTPDIILITSGMTYWYLGVKWCIDIVKKFFPKAPILLGGIYAQLCPGHAQKMGADGVQTMPLDISYFRPSLDLYKNPEYGITITSIGCPLNCRYCASKKLWPHYKKRPVAQVIDEISFQSGFATVKDIAFYDDALLIDKENHFYSLCEKLKENFGHLRYHTPNGLHVREIDETCARYLYETGFKTIRLSLEGTDPSVQKAGSDKVHDPQYIWAVENLLKAGYSHSNIETYILVGLPGQNYESVKKAIVFVKSLGATAKLAEYSPIPGTFMFEESAKALPALKEEPLYHNNTVYCGYLSPEITQKELQSLKDLAKDPT